MPFPGGEGPEGPRPSTGFSQAALRVRVSCDDTDTLLREMAVHPPQSQEAAWRGGTQSIPLSPHPLLFLSFTAFSSFCDGMSEIWTWVQILNPD